MSENIARYNVILELLTNTKGVDEAEKKVGGLQKTFNSAKVAFAGIIAANVVQQQLGKILDITKKYQQYNTILKVATGSQQEATKTLQLIENAASETVFSVDELTSSYIKFANRGLKPTKDEIISLADLAASQGKSFDQLTEAVLDASAGEFERLKEFGVKASKEGDKVTLSFRGVNQTIANTPEAINKAVISLGKLEGVAGSNAKQMKDLSGVISNIGDNTEKVYKNIGERLKGFFTESLGALAKFVEKLVEFTEIPVSQKLQEEQIELNALVQSITQTNVSQEKRNNLIAELQEKYPFFLKNIDAETASNDQLKARLREVNELYVKRIALQSQEEKIEKALKASGEAKTKELEIERKRRIELNKVVSQFKLPVDLNAIDQIDKQTSAVLDNLKKLFSTSTLASSGATIVNGNRAAFDSYTKLIGGFVNATGAANKYAKSLTEVEEQQAALRDFEKALGTDLAAINKLFDVAPSETTTTQPTGGGSKVKQDDPIKAAIEAKEKQYIQLALLEREYRDERLKDAENEITNQAALNRRRLEIEEQYSKNLQLIELYKQQGIAELKQKLAKKDSKDFFDAALEIKKLQDQIDQLNPKREKVDIVDILSPQDLALVKTNISILISEIDKLDTAYNKTFGDNDSGIKRVAILENIKNIKSEIKKSIESLGSTKLNNLTFISGGFDAVPLEDILPNDRVQVLKDRLVNIGNSVGQFKERLQEGLVSDPLELKGFDKLMDEGDQIIALFKRLGIEIPKEAAKIKEGSGNVLGVTPEQLKLAGDAVDIVSSGFSQATDIIRAELDKRIGIQEDRVKQAEKIAEKGNVKQLELEEERLAKLEEQRKEASDRAAILQKAAAQAEIIVNTALTISNLQVAAAKTAGSSGPAAPVTVPIVLAIVGGLIASAANLFKPPSFKDGIEYFSTKKDGRVTGPGTSRSDSVPAWLSNGERVVDAANNEPIKDFPNAKLPEAVKYYQMRSKSLPVIAMSASKDNSMMMESKLDALKESFEALRINVSLDQKGFIAEIDRLQQKRLDRQRYKA
jgi:hypothetical protein